MQNDIKQNAMLDLAPICTLNINFRGFCSRAKIGTQGITPVLEKNARGAQVLLAITPA